MILHIEPGCLCECLEGRQLLATLLTVFVDGVQVASGSTVNYGTVLQNSTGPIHTISVRNDGDTLDVSHALDGVIGGASLLFTKVSGPTFIDGFANGQTFTVKYRIDTDEARPHAADAEFRLGGTITPLVSVRLSGNVVRDIAANSMNFGPIGSGSAGDTGTITAIQRSDNDGNTIQQVGDYSAHFELTAQQSNVGLSLTGNSLPLPGVPNVYNEGKLNLLLAKDSNGDGKLSVAERESAITNVVTGPIDENLPQVVGASKTLTKGKYIVYVSAAEMFSSAFNTDSGQFVPNELGFSVDLNVTAIPDPQIVVTGKGEGVGAAGEPASTDNGTSFGTVLEGSLPTLTFTVRNSGGSALNISGQRPNVTGDFILVEGLSASIGVGQSDTFTVKLINTASGIKSGQVSILSNAALSNFTFAIGGTVQPSVNQPPFVSRSGNKLTVAGTSGDDTISITASGDVLTIKRNGVNNPTTFSVQQIKAIAVNCGNGDDIVSTTTNLRINMALNGGVGNDRLRSGKGKDVLNGGAGKDILDGAGNIDTLDGGAGSDYASYASRNYDLTISLDGKANDGEAGENDLIAANVEHVQGGKGDDRITGNTKGNILRGGPGNDVLIGGKGGDTLDGGPGANSLTGGAGKDVFAAHNGQKDTVNGGADDDEVTGDLIDLITAVETKSLV